MFEDPMDIFGEMDEMVARLFTRMDREFMHGTGVYRYRADTLPGEDAPAVAEADVPLSRDDREPVTEVHCIGNEVKVIAELPGITDAALQLDVRAGRLVIDAGDAGHHYHTSAALPPVDEPSLLATIKNGVLEVTFRRLPGGPGET